ncbi:hypothetical protein PFFCH_05581, partial [Plasmodium falciparum FCH/4]
MAPQGGGGGGNDYSDAKDAKELLDRIGEDVYKKIKDDAKTYDSYLKGNLNKANNSSEETFSTIKTCQLVEEYRRKNTGTADASGKSQPCRKDVKGEDINRFSDKQGAECANSKIEGNKNNSEGGACAPFRRLNLCNKNLETVSNYNSNARHKLLAEVCLAAKHEGQSISDYYPKYQEKYGDTGHTTCTMLARSFADIGDIIRGKDLFIGYDKKDRAQKKKLQDNLIEIFGKIYEDLTEPGVKNYYKNDDKDPNYYKLRE